MFFILISSLPLNVGKRYKFFEQTEGFIAIKVESFPILGKKMQKVSLFEGNFVYLP